jgi:ATP-dependent Lon protease
MSLALLIVEERYKAMFDACMAGDSRFGVALISVGPDAAGKAVPHPVGTVARILSSERLSDGRIKVMTVGEHRFRVVEAVDGAQPYPAAVVEYLDDEAWERRDAPRLMRDLSDDFLDYLTLTMLLSGHSLPVGQLELSGDPSVLSYRVASSLQVDATEKQRLLEDPSALERLRRELVLVRRERDFLQRLINLHGVVGDLDMRWGLKLYRKNDAPVNLPAPKDSLSDQ